MKRAINGLLGRFGYKLLVDSPLLFHGQELNRLYREAPWIRYWLELDHLQRQRVSPYLWESKSQLGQDLFAMLSASSNDGSSCYFVDIGASDGVRFSNSWLLETALGWSGVVAEPARSWHERLAANRTCIIEQRAIYGQTGQRLQFLDVSNTVGYPELSSLHLVKDSDDRSSVRSADSSIYDVETVALSDMLQQHDAPAQIDFLSIDTEGSEFEIIRTLDFSRYHFKAICVEHNYNKSLRRSLHDHLAANGYCRVHQSASAWDDWYVPVP